MANPDLRHGQNDIRDHLDQISADIRDLRLRFPENESALQHFQSYAESVDEQSSIIHINGKGHIDSFYHKLDTGSSTTYSREYDALVNLASL